ncbi:hypothetical protein ElyMa_004493800 [Elysia marginata]|uniref:Uncharacterized protein n=1 Tax=Elysia marginata TaxID=1093978 RepID=A0AAV4HL88_9GAST|nr:hypothetical protein ElyMa_004493800 [Elysia marginata]
MAPAKIESASEISKRYGLAGLVRARVLARRFALNAMARRMSTSMQDSLELFYSDLVPMESELVSPRNYLLALDQPEDAVIPRPAALPAYETRLYNRRLAEMEALSLDANDRADRLLDRYFTRSRASAAILDGNSQNEVEEEGREGARMNTRSGDTGKNTKENGAKISSETDRNEDVTEEDEVNELLEDAYENNYLDLMASTYDRPVWRQARRRLLRRRLLPYTFRPLTATNRLLARRGLLE